MRAALAPAALAALVGIGTTACRSPTQITLEVSTNVACSSSTYQGMTITVGRLDEVEGKAPVVVTSGTCGNTGGAVGRIGSLVLVPSGAKDDEIAIKVVVGSTIPATECVGPLYRGCIVARRALHFVPHEPLDLPVSMSSSCLDKACDPHSTCVNGNCIPAEIDDSTQCKGDGCSDDNLGKQHPSDGGVLDSSLDGGDGTPTDAPDARADGETAVDSGPLPGHVLELELAANFSCAHLEDHSLKCWGAGIHGQLNDGKTTDSYVPVAVNPIAGVIRQLGVGDNVACVALEDGTVTCWGQNEYGECGIAPSFIDRPPTKVTGIGTAVQVAPGFRHVCARLAPDGRVMCWGDQTDGSLGNGASSGTSLPVTNGLVGAAQVTPWCARLTSGEVHCWGRGFLTPQKVPGLPGKAIDIDDSTEGKVFVVVEGGGVYWARGDTAVGWSNPATASATPGTSPVKRAISSYGDTYELLEDGSVYFVEGLSGTPKLVSGLGPGTVQRLDGGLSDHYGRSFRCVILTSGGVRCWGSDLHGELGIDRPCAVRTPQRIPASSLSGVARIRRFEAAFDGMTAAIKADGSVSAWGAAPVLALSDVATPTAMSKLGVGNKDLALGADLEAGYVVRTDGSIASIDAGAITSTGLSGKFTDVSYALVAATFHMAARGAGPLEFFAVNADANSDGIFGRGDLTPPAVGSITAVTLPATPKGIVGHANDFGVGNQTICGWLSDGKVYCWGDNQTGMCGSPIRSAFFDTPQPISFPGGTTPGIVSMCNGGRHACALSDAVDGKKVYCWGDNVDGELGLASPVDTNVALQVPGVSNVAGITCFGTSTCAWLADSTKSVTCWGTNDKGQLGDGTLIGRPTPKTVPGLSDVIGMDGSCAWTSTGDAWCWGDSYSGQAGIGISGNVTVPTDVKGL